MLEIQPPNSDFKGSTLITGFHGIGATGYWTIKFLVQNLKTQRMAFLDSPSLPPMSSYSENHLVTPYEFYRKDDLVFFKAEAPPFKGTEVEFFRTMAKWVIKSEIKEVVLLGGLDLNLRADDSLYRLAHTRAYEPHGKLKDSKNLEDDHMIVGPVAILLNMFEIYDFPACAILAYASTDRLDPRAAATTVKLLAGQYDFQVDVSSLMSSAEVLESQVSRPQGGPNDSIYT